MIGLYLHVPYCTARCSYCDFYLVQARGHDLEEFGRALTAEIAGVASPLRGRAADSVHFGGGTPSLLPASVIAAVLEGLRDTFALSRGAEIALEANPEDIEAGKLDELAALGVNRLSVGVQSFDDDLLGLLRRPHDAARAMAAIEEARRSSIHSVGVDLILGLPGQRRDEALAGIERVAERGVDHISIYLLEVHPRTRLGRQIALGMVVPSADDAVAVLFEAAADLLVARGYEHYEISNFALPGQRSRHNLKYWTDREYLGFGPAAHSYVGGRRWSNAPDLAAYLGSRGIDCRRIDDPQPPAGRGGEALCAGLRITEGIDLVELRRRYGTALPAPDDPRIAQLCEEGLMRLAGSRLTLTRRGRLVSNEVFERLLPAGGTVAHFLS